MHATGPARHSQLTRRRGARSPRNPAFATVEHKGRRTVLRGPERRDDGAGRGAERALPVMDGGERRRRKAVGTFPARRPQHRQPPRREVGGNGRARHAAPAEPRADQRMLGRDIGHVPAVDGDHPVVGATPGRALRADRDLQVLAQHLGRQRTGAAASGWSRDATTTMSRSASVILSAQGGIPGMSSAMARSATPP